MITTKRPGNVKRAKVLTRAEKDLLACVPTSWLDPILTGPDAVIKSPYNSRQIEILLTAIRERIRARLAKERAK